MFKFDFFHENFRNVRTNMDELCPKNPDNLKKKLGHFQAKIFNLLNIVMKRYQKIFQVLPKCQHLLNISISII